MHRLRLLREQILSPNPVLTLHCIQEQPQYLVKMQVLVHRVGVRPEILHLSWAHHLGTPRGCLFVP